MNFFLVTNLIRANSPGSLIGGIVESPGQEKVREFNFFSDFFYSFILFF
jgi:hypothetical protein